MKEPTKLLHRAIFSDDFNKLVNQALSVYYSYPSTEERIRYYINKGYIKLKPSKN